MHSIVHMNSEECVKNKIIIKYHAKNNSKNK